MKLDPKTIKHHMRGVAKDEQKEIERHSARMVALRNEREFLVRSCDHKWKKKETLVGFEYWCPVCGTWKGSS